jgi:FdhD protein
VRRRDLAQAIRRQPRWPTRPALFEPAALVRGMGQLRARQPLLAATGLHARGYGRRRRRLHLVREDVGRHNALDKLRRLARCPRGEGAGWPAAEGFRGGQQPRQPRDGPEDRAAASPAAVRDHAGRGQRRGAGLCLLGFARGADFSVYTQARRVASERLSS